MPQTAEAVILTGCAKEENVLVRGDLVPQFRRLQFPLCVAVPMYVKKPFNVAFFGLETTGFSRGELKL
jgi:hypothetical protein